MFVAQALCTECSSILGEEAHGQADRRYDAAGDTRPRQAYSPSQHPLPPLLFPQQTGLAPRVFPQQSLIHVTRDPFSPKGIKRAFNSDKTGPMWLPVVRSETRPWVQTQEAGDQPSCLCSPQNAFYFKDPIKPTVQLHLEIHSSLFPQIHLFS